MQQPRTESENSQPGGPSRFLHAAYFIYLNTGLASADLTHKQRTWKNALSQKMINTCIRRKSWSILPLICLSAGNPLAVVAGGTRLIMMGLPFWS
jgi:hypothetical protein